MALGNPDSASTNSTSRTKFLINARAQYAISYNDDTHQANWVSWSYSLDDDGTQARTDAWAKEELLPAGYLQIGTATFGTGWDRGHMTPSADRTKDLTNNQVTFRMSNIIPQASQNNQGLWGNFEDYCRAMAAGGDEILIVSGPAQFNGTRLGNQMAIPGSVWKIAVEIPNANSSTPANQRITTAARVIAILTPNTSTGLGPWQSYITSVEHIEEVTGLNFFADLDPSTAIYLKNIVDTGTSPNSPTVVTTFNPTLGAPGTSVTISGYNFGAAPVVNFNGTPAAVQTTTANSVTVTVPAGATSGFLTVQGPGGTDTSYEPFTVTAGAAPTLGLTPRELTGLTASQGSEGTPVAYALTGTSLTGSTTLSAPTNFELSKDGGNTFADTLTLTPDIDGSLGAQIYVRIKAGPAAGIVSGTITHAGGGLAAEQIVNVSGSVVINGPALLLSTNTLAGFSAVQNTGGASKSYTVSATHLVGDVVVTAPAGFQVSTDALTYSNSLILSPSSGTLSATMIFARLAASATSGAVSGTFTHASSGAAQRNLIVSGTVGTSVSQEASTITWDFTTASPASGVPAGVAVSDVTQGNNNGTTTMLTTTSASSGYTGASGGNNAGAAARVGPLVTGTNGSAYFEFTVIPQAGSSFTMDGISFGSRSTSTGPAAFALRNSGDGYAADIASGALSTNSSWAISSVSGLTAGSSNAATFRVYGYNGSGSPNASTANWRIDDLKVFLTTTTVASSQPPAITSATNATATAFTPFSYQITATNSPTSFGASGLPEGLSIDAAGLITGTFKKLGTYKVLMIAGNAGGDGTANLTITVDRNPGAPLITGTLSATAPAGSPFSYQITASNSPTAYLAENLPSGLTIDPLTGTISGEASTPGTSNVLLTAVNALGSDTQTLTITVLAPVINVSQTDLAFTSSFGLASAAQNYSVTGSDLASTITVLAPENFEVSDNNGASYFDELTLTPAANRTLNATIHVRMKASAPLGESAGAIVLSGADAVPKYVQLYGWSDVTGATLALSISSLPAFSTKVGTPSFVESYTLSGVGLTAPVTITAPAGYQVSIDNTTFAASAVVPPNASGVIAAQEVFVRMLSATAGTFEGSISHIGGGAADKYLAVAGTVTTPVGPPITSPLSGSCYTNAIFSNKITVGGPLPVTSYGASNLPAGLSVNTTNGVVSGSVATAGSYTFNVSASTQDGTTTTNYNLRVVSATEQTSIPLSVAINKYQNSTTDRVELLVIGNTNDAAPGPPVDMRGMILKDFGSNMAADTGGKYQFTSNAFWASVKAGTLVVLSAGTSAAEDFDASDWVVSINLGNTDYFTHMGGIFDIGNTDMVMIKPASMGVEGVAGAIHALATGSSGTLYSGFSGKKVRSSNALTSSKTYAYVLNDSSKLSDFYASQGADVATALTFGSGNNSKNRSYITTLRNLDQTPPVVALNGNTTVTLVVGGNYTEQGATATGATTGVTISGSVITAAAGTYTLTYSAADAAGNVGAVTRTVRVLTAANYSAQVTYGLSGANAALSADPDGDQVSNLIEYALGGDPTTNDAHKLQPFVSTSEGKLRLSTVVRSDDPAVVTTAQTTTDLKSSWTTKGVSELPNVSQSGVAQGFVRRTWELDSTATCQFLRLNVSISP